MKEGEYYIPGPPEGPAYSPPPPKPAPEPIDLEDDAMPVGKQGAD